jgi:hypothetical protein
LIVSAPEERIYTQGPPSFLMTLLDLVLGIAIAIIGMIATYVYGTGKGAEQQAQADQKAIDTAKAYVPPGDGVDLEEVPPVDVSGRKIGGINLLGIYQIWVANMPSKQIPYNNCDAHEYRDVYVGYVCVKEGKVHVSMAVDEREPEIRHFDVRPEEVGKQQRVTFKWPPYDTFKEPGEHIVDIMIGYQFEDEPDSPVTWYRKKEFFVTLV